MTRAWPSRTPSVEGVGGGSGGGATDVSAYCSERLSCLLSRYQSVHLRAKQNRAPCSEK